LLGLGGLLLLLGTLGRRVAAVRKQDG
jgi:hypothetical protein